MQYQLSICINVKIDGLYTAMTWRTLNTVTRHVGRACLGLGLELEISNDWIPVSSSVQAGPLSRSLVQCPGPVYLETAALEQRWEASYSSAGGGYPAHDKWSLAGRCIHDTAVMLLLSTQVDRILPPHAGEEGWRTDTKPDLKKPSAYHE